ncbi:hypothetical protein GCM10007987_07400 [Aliivibrio fischeri]|nr:hypothetical protein GCM10007987_07400 [Aliivibrio fischeri]
MDVGVWVVNYCNDGSNECIYLIYVDYLTYEAHFLKYFAQINNKKYLKTSHLLNFEYTR